MERNHHNTSSHTSEQEMELDPLVRNFIKPSKPALLTKSEIVSPVSYNYKQKVEHFVLPSSEERSYLNSLNKTQAFSKDAILSKRQGTVNNSGNESKGGERAESSKEGLLIRSQFKLPVLLQQVDSLQNYIIEVEKLKNRILIVEDYMLEQRQIRTSEFITHGEFNVNMTNIIKELELAVENKMESVYTRLKSRIDEKASKEEVDGILKLKANSFEVNRYFQLIEEKILQITYDAISKGDQVYRNIQEKMEKREERFKEIESLMQNKVDSKVMTDVLERVNKLESLFDFEPYDTSNQTVGSVEDNKSENRGSSIGRSPLNIQIDKFENTQILTDKKELEDLTLLNLKHELREIEPAQSEARHGLSNFKQESSGNVNPWSPKQHSLSRHHTPSFMKYKQESEQNLQRPLEKKKTVSRKSKSGIASKASSKMNHESEAKLQQNSSHHQLQGPQHQQTQLDENIHNLTPFHDIRSNTIIGDKKFSDFVLQNQMSIIKQSTEGGRKSMLEKSVDIVQTNDSEVKKPKSQSGKSNNEGKLSAASVGSSGKISQMFKKQQILFKKFIDDKIKEAQTQLYTSDLIDKMQSRQNEMENTIKEMDEKSKKTYEYMTQMKSNFDTLTIHKRQFELMVQKPIQHAEKIRTQLIEMITQNETKTKEQGNSKQSRIIEMQNECMKIKNESELSQKRLKKLFNSISTEFEQMKQLRKEVLELISSNFNLKKEIMTIKSDIMEERFKRNTTRSNEIGDHKHLVKNFFQNNVLNNILEKDKSQEYIQLEGYARELENTQKINREILQEFFKLLDEKKNLIILNSEMQQQQVIQQIQDTINLQTSLNIGSRTNPFLKTQTNSPRSGVKPFHNLNLNALNLSTQRGLLNQTTMQSTYRERFRSQPEFRKQSNEQLQQIEIKKQQMLRKFNVPLKDLIDGGLSADNPIANSTMHNRSLLGEKSNEAKIIIPQINQVQKLKNEVIKRKSRQGLKYLSVDKSKQISDQPRLSNHVHAEIEVNKLEARDSVTNKFTPNRFNNSFQESAEELSRQLKKQEDYKEQLIKSPLKEDFGGRNVKIMSINNINLTSSSDSDENMRYSVLNDSISGNSSGEEKNGLFSNKKKDSLKRFNQSSKALIGANKDEPSQKSSFSRIREDKKPPNDSKNNLSVN